MSHLIFAEVQLEHTAIGQPPPPNSGRTEFLRSTGGKTLTFEAADAEASVLSDRETGSRWNAYGTCVSGRMKGSILESLVLEPEYWFAWSEFHHDTTVYTPPRP